jgi:hypothetical protein
MKWKYVLHNVLYTVLGFTEELYTNSFFTELNMYNIKVYIRYVFLPINPA